MSASLDDLVPELRDAAKQLVQLCGESGLLPQVTSVLRSRSEQTRLYRAYLQGRQGFPVAPPGQSAHEYGWAFDLTVSPMEALADVGAVWNSWGGFWGPGDAVHFELAGATALARQQQSTAPPDQASLVDEPLLAAAQFAEKLPWYAQLFEPWQLSLLEQFPFLRPIFAMPMSPAEIKRQWAYITNLLG